MANTDAQTLDQKYLQKVQSIDGIINSLYEVVSGDTVNERNWELLKYLLQPEAKLISYGKGANGESSISYMTADDYIARAGAFFKQTNFYESEISREVEHFGPMAHVFSTYQSSAHASGEAPFARGINSIQLLNDGKRWWIVNIYWASETPENPLPAHYLRKN